MESGDTQDYLMKNMILPDRELLLWEKWVQVRKEETTHLAEKTNRAPADLTMNLLEKVREDKERKIVLEHAQIKKKPTVRGFLWEQPERLKQKCYCKPVYEVQRTRAEKGRPRIIEHIGVPEYIQITEKGLSGNASRKPCPQLNREYEDYRTKREDDLKDKIKKIDPHRPEINQLMIKGSKPKPPPKKMPPLPEIKETTIIDTPPHLSESVFALRINNTVFIKDIPGQKLRYLWNIKNEPWHESCNYWSYYFNAPVSRMGRSKLFLQNLGTVTLRYCWKKIRRSIPFIPEDVYEQVFYFNKNEDVLSPGQSKEIFFTFISSKPGIYSESWELNTCNVCFFDTLGDKIILNLQGDSVENIDRSKRKVEFLKERISRKAIKNIVRNAINNAIEEAVAVKPQIYPYKKLFLEAEIFVMKNPVCFYHQTEVMKMKESYTEMVPGELWDLSIANWRDKMMHKQYEERMKYYQILKNSHSRLIKPWFEGEDLLKQKYRAVMIFLGQMADKFDEEYLQISKTMGVDIQGSESDDKPSSKMTIQSTKSIDPLVMDTIRNIFYVRAYEHVAVTIEVCAGVLSSLDLNRWIEFDFCRS
ncbi:uncharacterized protein [Epargyreus clarus]|uniref:uncharacterized protein n=1 Tax=Epargyreus clarus TaxID=520877 RepID=UPI003C2E8745